MTRPLTTDERAVLMALITSGRCEDDVVVSAADRARWLSQVPAARAGRPCGCGTCPSIDLTIPSGVTPGPGGSRVVLSGSTREALLMLFVDDDRLSYLELAPLDDDTFLHRWPPATDIDVG